MPENRRVPQFCAKSGRLPLPRSRRRSSVPTIHANRWAAAPLLSLRPSQTGTGCPAFDLLAQFPVHQSTAQYGMAARAAMRYGARQRDLVWVASAQAAQMGYPALASVQMEGVLAAMAVVVAGPLACWRMDWALHQTDYCSENKM